MIPIYDASSLVLGGKHPTSTWTEDDASDEELNDRGEVNLTGKRLDQEGPPELIGKVPANCFAWSQRWQVEDAIEKKFNVLLAQPGKYTFRYTTAPEAYDFAGTFTVEAFELQGLGASRPTQWRKVLIKDYGNHGEDFTRNQAYRYGSGCKACAEVDPRVELADYLAKEVARKAQEAADTAAKVADAELLAALSDADLQKEVDKRNNHDCSAQERACSWCRLDGMKRAREALKERHALRHKEAQQSRYGQMLQAVKPGMVFCLEEVNLPRARFAEVWIEIEKIGVIDGSAPTLLADDVSVTCSVSDLGSADSRGLITWTPGSRRGQGSAWISLGKLYDRLDSVKETYPRREVRDALTKAGIVPSKAVKLSLLDGSDTFWVGRALFVSEYTVIKDSTAKRARGKLADAAIIQVRGY